MHSKRLIVPVLTYAAVVTASNRADAQRAPTAQIQEVRLSDSGGCARIDDGSVRCWGFNSWGQLGDGSRATRVVPVQVRGLRRVAEIGVSREFACARLEDGSVSCWGHGSAGQLGNGDERDRPTPVPVRGVAGATQLSVGAHSACVVIQDGSLRCWGNPGNGALGNGSTQLSLESVAVSGIANAAQVAVGGSGFACARLRDGSVRCWGNNGEGQLGDGTVEERHEPVAVRGVRNAADLVVGPASACARAADNNWMCWGRDSSAQLGFGDASATRSTPAAAALLHGVVQLSIGMNASCGRLGDGSVRCWGSNSESAMGSAEDARHPEGVTIAGLTGTTSIAMGSFQGCAIVGDGTARCWGDNRDGQAGTGTRVRNMPPTSMHASLYRASH